MNLADVPLLSMLKERMSWLSARQTVLSENVANADAPGYTAKDIKPIDFEDELKKSQMATHSSAGSLFADNPRHISVTSNSNAQYTDIDTPDVADSKSGNSVSLEAEMIKVSETQSDFQAASNLYAKAMQMMRTAIGQP